MLHSDTSLADANQLRLVADEPKLAPHYVWSAEDQAMCTSILSAAQTAGVTITDDCTHAIARAADPENEVDLGGVILAELGQDTFLTHLKNRGIATLAASLFQCSSSPALQIAGQQLAARVEIADSDVVPLEGSSAVMPFLQDDNWTNVH